MRIAAANLVLPEDAVANDAVVDLVGFHSKSTFSGDLSNLRRLMLRLLQRAGSETRYWSHQRKKPIDYVAEAANGALSKAGLAASEIELVISCSVDRGFYEPANAYFLARQLGITSAQCFDVLDACNGWARSLQICNAFFETGIYRNALLLNAEFPMFEGGPVFPKLYGIDHVDQLQHRFPAFTLGEGAAATVVTNEADANWRYHTSSHPSYADLCAISCQPGKRFAEDSPRLDVDGPGHFLSFGDEMKRVGLDHSIEILEELSTSWDRIDVIFPHTVSQNEIDAVASRIGVSQLVYSVFPKVGNLISASIPATISLAIADGRVKPANVAAGWVGSAGMVFSSFTFTV